MAYVSPLEKMSAMDPICEALCSLNDDQPGRRHLIAISFDHPNHGGRLIHRASNFAWKEGKHQNPMHAQDMWSMYHSSACTVSQLIDVVEDYLFGPQEQSRVQVWGVMGFSMGGHATFLAAASGKKNINPMHHTYRLFTLLHVDPRISVAIPIVGTADFLSLLRDRLAQSSLSEKDHLPRRFCDMVDAKTANLDIRLKNTKLLMISGAKDQLVPGNFNLDLVNRLGKTHTGKQGRDWAFVIVPNCGHEWSKTMFDLSVAWCNQWMVQIHPATDSIETTLKAHL